MAKEYIEREALLFAFGEEPMVWDERDDAEVQERFDWRRYTEIVKEQSAADVVEVVHDKKRKQIAERLKDYHDRNTPGDYKTSIFGVAALLLEQDASAERHGHWIGLEYDGYADGCPVYDLWECSECGEEVSGEDVPDTHLYCHGCGARMGDS